VAVPVVQAELEAEAEELVPLLLLQMELLILVGVVEDTNLVFFLHAPALADQGLLFSVMLVPIQMPLQQLVRLPIQIQAVTKLTSSLPVAQLHGDGRWHTLRNLMKT
jgi:hypothetical protein